MRFKHNQGRYKRTINQQSPNFLPKNASKSKDKITMIDTNIDKYLPLISVHSKNVSNRKTYNKGRITFKFTNPRLLSDSEKATISKNAQISLGKIAISASKQDIINIKSKSHNPIPYYGDNFSVNKKNSRFEVALLNREDDNDLIVCYILICCVFANHDNFSLFCLSTAG